MAKLFISFRVNLWDYESEHSGAIFHRWLPDGEKNSIKLDTNDPNVNLKVWFERCGYKDDTFIRYNENRREVDPKIMSTQGCLYSGPLFGMLEIDSLSAEQIQTIRDSKSGNENYKNLIKIFIKDYIYRPVTEFIEVIRMNLGQFWVKQILKYDSRNQSLGYYSRDIFHMQCSLDGRRSWKVIDPDTKETIRANFTLRSSPDYLQFITKKDWESISKFKYSNRSSTPFLIRSHRLCEEGDLRLAFIEGVTALELSIHEFIRNKASSKLLSKSSESFFNLPLRTQLTILCSCFGSIPEEQTESCITAIKLRNDIVHDGINPNDETKTLLYALLYTVSYLSGDENCKFPSKRFSTCSVSEESWPKYYKMHNHASAPEPPA